MKKKLFFIFLLFLLIFPFLVLSPKIVKATNTLGGLNQAASVVDAFKDQVDDDTTTSKAFIQTKAGAIVGIVLSFVGILFLILIIYAGIQWMTANGNEEQVKKAKGLIINSIVGIIIIFAAYAITSFIGSKILN